MQSTREDEARVGDSGSNRRLDNIGSDVKAAFGEAAEGVKEQVRESADRTKREGAERLEGVTRAFHSAAEELSRELPQAAGFIHSAADNLNRAASSLRERSVEDLVSSFNGFARRQPAAAFAGAVLAGLVVSRFLKSSAPRNVNRA
jgi:hypothetical protein